MNNKHKKTLVAVFHEPAFRTIAWRDIEVLLVAVGAEMIEGAGSRVRFCKDGEIGIFHRPHPAREAKAYQVRAARDFLTRIGVEP